MTALREPVRAGTLAGPLDAHQHGEFRVAGRTADRTPAFRDRITAGRLGRFPAVAGRYHLYSAAPSPAAHRVEIVRLLAGLDTVVSLSRTDNLRDARGWAFRGASGGDPVNDFALLRDAYEATVPGFAGRVDVPVLWDRVEHRIVSDDADAIAADLASCFGPNPLRRHDEDEAVRADRAIATRFSAQLGPALRDRAAAESVLDVLRRADRRLAERPYLLGDRLSDADVAFWVALVRYDVGVNAHRAVGPALPAYRGVWRWAQSLLTLPAFAATTDVAAFAAPFADLTYWTGSA